MVLVWGDVRMAKFFWKICQKYNFDLQISKTNFQLFPIYMLWKCWRRFGAYWSIWEGGITSRSNHYTPFDWREITRFPDARSDNRFANRVRKLRWLSSHRRPVAKGIRELHGLFHATSFASKKTAVAKKTQRENARNQVRVIRCTAAGPHQQYTTCILSEFTVKRVFS